MSESTPSGNSIVNWKTIRVFISSTFRDMHAERDYLVKYVFPELREWCQQYKLHLVDIDLRWGVTSSEAESGKVLDICLDQIDGSRPFFIGMLGSRYGWVPNKKEVSEETRKVYDRLNGKENYSITHLEIQHAVLEPLRSLDALEEVPHAFFYFRGKDSLPSSDELHNYSNQEKEEYRKTYLEEDENNADRLDELKQEIQTHYRSIGETKGNIHESEERIFTYHPNFEPSLSNPEDDKLKGRFTPVSFKEFGIRVQTDLKKAISLQFDERIKALSERKEQNNIETERDLHESFVENRTRLFIGRTQLLTRLHEYVNSDSRKILAVFGEPGSGKSALLAKFYRDFKFDENGNEMNKNVLFIPHFAGASPGSCFLPSILRRFCEELKVAYKIDDYIPMESNKLSETFRSFIGKANGKVVILIDGLNQLDEAEHAQELNWLPYELPANLKIIASTLEGKTKGALLKKTNESLAVTQLTNEECREIINKIPSVFCKTLDEKHIKLLLTKEESRNPLYLKVALDELRVFGSFEKLEIKIAALPSDIESLFISVLERLEKDSADESGIVEWLFCLLECSRFGLAPQELRELMGTVDKHNTYQAILRQMRDYIISRGELIDFFHRGLSKAIRQKYLAHGEAILWHKIISEYFRRQSLWLDKPTARSLAGQNSQPEQIPNQRKLQELPWQQTEGRLTEELIETLTNLDFIETKCKANLRYELVSDYSHAEICYPDYEESRRAEMERRLRMDRYVEELISHSSDPENHPPPEPPCSVAFDTIEPTRPKEAGWTHQETLQGWGHFVANHITRIGGEEPTFQMAYNIASSGPVAEQLEQSLQCDQFNKAPWIKLLNRPSYSPSPVCQKVLVGNASRITSITISADGSKVMAAGKYALDVWNLLTGEHESTLAGAHGVCMTPDMRRAISGLNVHHNAQDCGLWDLATGECAKILSGHKADIGSVSITPDGKRAVSGAYGSGGDNTMRLWDCSTGECLEVLGEGIHCNRLKTVLISNNAKYAIAAPGDDFRNIYVWDLQNAKLLYTLKTPFKGIAISSDSSIIVATSQNKMFRDSHEVFNTQIQIWDLPIGTLRIIHDISKEIGDRRIGSLALSADSKYAVNTVGGSLCVWDLQNGKCLREFFEPSCGHIISCTITPDCRIAVTGELGNAVRVWDLQGSIPLTVCRQVESINKIRISRNRSQILTETSSLSVGVWDIETQIIKNELKWGEDDAGWTSYPGGSVPQIRALQPLADEHYCIIGRSMSLQLWNISDKSPVSVLLTKPSGSGAWIFDLNITADGSRALWNNTRTKEDKRIGVLMGWDMKSGQAFESIDGHRDTHIIASALTSDGRMAITTSFDKTLRIWDLESMTCVSVLEGHTSEVDTVEISPDNCCCISIGRGYGEGNLRIWNLNRKSQAKDPLSSGSRIDSIQFLPDGRRILTKNVVRGAVSVLMNIRSGKVSTINERYSYNALFSPDSHAVAWNQGNMLGLYDIDNYKDATWLGYSGNPCTALALSWPYFLLGMESGVLSVYSFERVEQGQAIVTPLRLWLFGLYGQAGRWDTKITTVCEWCGTRFNTPPKIIDTIRQIGRTANLTHDSVPSLELPDEAWDEPGLISECPSCKKPLRYNPFMVDNRDRFASSRVKPLIGAMPSEKATPVPDLPVWQGASASTENAKLTFPHLIQKIPFFRK